MRPLDVFGFSADARAHNFEVAVLGAAERSRHTDASIATVATFGCNGQSLQTCARAVERFGWRSVRDGRTITYVQLASAGSKEVVLHMRVVAHRMSA